MSNDPTAFTSLASRVHVSDASNIKILIYILGGIKTHKKNVPSPAVVDRHQ